MQKGPRITAEHLTSELVQVYADGNPLVTIRRSDDEKSWLLALQNKEQPRGLATLRDAVLSVSLDAGLLSQEAFQTHYPAFKLVTWNRVSDTEFAVFRDGVPLADVTRDGITYRWAITDRTGRHVNAGAVQANEGEGPLQVDDYYQPGDWFALPETAIEFVMDHVPLFTAVEFPARQAVEVPSC